MIWPFRRRAVEPIKPAEFRVVTNGTEFKVQIKRGDSAWSDCARVGLHYFDNSKDAHKFKRALEREDQRATREWAPAEKES